MILNLDPMTAASLILLEKEPFFGGMLRGIKRRYAAMSTASISVTPTGTVVLRGSRAFFEGMTGPEGAAVIKHELLHLVYGHCSAERTLDMPNEEVANLAMDLTINQQITGLPAGCLDVATWTPEPLPPGKTADWYYAAIMAESGGEGGEPGEGNPGTVDEHSGLSGGGEGACPEITDAAVKRVVGQGKAEAMAQGWGTVPGAVKMAVEQVLAAKPLNWKQLTRRMVQNAARSGTVSTRKKRNRRYGLRVPGRKVVRRVKVAVAIDTSGSIFCDPQVLGAFYAECNKIAAYADITVIECDARVGAIYKWTGKAPTQTSGGGGTRFAPAFDAAAELGVDCLIYLTDGEADFPSKRAGYPDALWVITNERRMGRKRFGKDVFMSFDRS